MKRGLTELEVEFEISMDLCREKPHEYDAKNQILKNFPKIRSFILVGQYHKILNLASQIIVKTSSKEKFKQCQ